MYRARRFYPVPKSIMGFQELIEICDDFGDPLTPQSYLVKTRLKPMHSSCHDTFYTQLLIKLHLVIQYQMQEVSQVDCYPALEWSLE